MIDGLAVAVGLAILASVVLFVIEDVLGRRLIASFHERGPVCLDVDADLTPPAPHLGKDVVVLRELRLRFPDHATCLFAPRFRLRWRPREQVRGAPIKGTVRWRDGRARVTVRFPMALTALLACLFGACVAIGVVAAAGALSEKDLGPLRWASLVGCAGTAFLAWQHWRVYAECGRRAIGDLREYLAGKG